jgi:uncharacterized membrane protein
MLIFALVLYVVACVVCVGLTVAFIRMARESDRRNAAIRTYLNR